MKISSTILLVSVLFSVASIAAVPADINQTDRQKAKIVSRLYQTTYGPVERCKKATPDSAAEFKNELARFSKINASLIKMVTKSPYYDSAKQKYSKHESPDPARDTPESLAGECKFYSELLRSMSDTPEGKKAVKEYEVLLSK